MASRVRAAVSRRLSAVLLLCATSAFAPGAAAATCPELEAALTAQGQAQFDEQHVNVLYCLSLYPNGFVCGSDISSVRLKSE